LTTRKTSNQDETKEYLNLEEGRALVQLARRAITKYLEEKQILRAPHEAPEKLSRKSGVFVTLNTVKPAHELRGCIGFPYPTEPLVNATIKSAIYAATEDPRFPPVTLDEFRNFVAVELTVLTPPQNLEIRDRKILPEMITVGRHGLIVEGMGSSGLLLPQVATEWHWDASEFLTNCCLKAGLPPDSWLLDGVKVKTFEGEIFAEVEPAGEIRRKVVGGA
jgi:uncharacterized protein (TIGR00296 family)